MQNTMYRETPKIQMHIVPNLNTAGYSKRGYFGEFHDFHDFNNPGLARWHVRGGQKKRNWYAAWTGQWSLGFVRLVAHRVLSNNVQQSVSQRQQQTINIPVHPNMQCIYALSIGSSKITRKNIPLAYANSIDDGLYNNDNYYKSAIILGSCILKPIIAWVVDISAALYWGVAFYLGYYYLVYRLGRPYMSVYNAALILAGIRQRTIGRYKDGLIAIGTLGIPRAHLQAVGYSTREIPVHTPTCLAIGMPRHAQHTPIIYRDSPCLRQAL